MTRFVFWETPPEVQAQAMPLYAELAALRMEWAPVKLARKYRPDQPRVPAGNGRASGRWSGDGLDSWRNYPRKIAKHRRVTSVPPKDAIFYRTTDGKIFRAPPGTDFQQVYAAGQNIRNIPISQQRHTSMLMLAKMGFLIFNAPATRALNAALPPLTVNGWPSCFIATVARLWISIPMSAWCRSGRNFSLMRIPLPIPAVVKR